MKLNVYVLYSGDCWLSTNSLEIIGVFSDYKIMLDAIRSFAKRRVSSKREVIEDYVDEFICNNNQTQGHNVNVIAETYTLNDY